ncbi:ABC transporter ATP-binding protein [Balneolaceae bacterium ANBcel3]|nr:ABC transporter ATP-binding protein [Balneolaceae bacterium ANBcel3]
MILAEELKKEYGQVTALDINRLEIPKGECFGLVGNNGAGKTTFFRLMLDMIRPTHGSVSIKGENTAESDSWKQFTGSYLDEAFLINYLTPEEYFRFLAKIYHCSKKELSEYLEPFSDFFRGEVLGRGKYIRELSKGNIKKVGIVSAFFASPEIIILDEPFENLDPGSQIMLKELIQKEQAEREVTFLISSHDLNHVTEICDRIVLLEKGEIIKDLKGDEHTLLTLKTYFQSN